MNLHWRWAALKNGFQEATAYRWEFLIEVLTEALVPVMTQIVLWYALFHMSGATQIGGLSYQDLITYSIFSLLFSQVRGGNLDFELAELIRTGSLSNYLLRPVGLIEFIWLRGSSSKFFLAGLGLAVGLVTCIFTGHSAGRMVGAMFLALLGNILHYQLSAGLAAVAFYWEESHSVLMVKNLLVSLLSGELIHLGIVPKEWKWVWESLPFHLFVFGPVQYATGQWSHEVFIQKVLFAGAWIIAGALMVRAAWSAGIGRYQSLGG